MRNCITPSLSARCSTSTIGGSTPPASIACPRKRIGREENEVQRAATFGELGVKKPSLTGLGGLVRLSATFALAAGCRSATPTATPKGPEQLAVYEPSRALNGLFHDVQLSGVFPDSKTFVDARPLETPAQITAAYVAERLVSGFSMRTFVEKHFEMPRAAGAGVQTETSLNME